MVLALTMLLSGSQKALASEADSLRQRHLKQVTVRGAQKQKARKNAAPEQVILHDEMANFGAQNVSDAVKHMAGVTLRDYGGAGGLKTVSIRGLGAQFTGVSYDGVALSDIQSGQIDLQRYTLSGVKQVSLTVGDGTDIFVSARSAALPSMLNINTFGTSDDDQQLHLTAQATLGAWGYTNPMVRAEKNFGKLSLSALADYVYAENDYPFTVYNLKERIHKHRVNSLMNQGHAELNAAFRFNPQHSVALKLYYYDNDRQLPGIVRYYTSESKQQLRERNAFAQLQYNGKLGNRWSLKSAAKWNWALSDYQDKLYSNRIQDAQYWQREGYLTNALQWKPADNLALCYASDYIYNSLNSHAMMVQNSRPTRQTLLNTLSLRWNLVFLTANVRILRSDYLNKTKAGTSGKDYHRWTPSASLSLKVAEGWNARVMWKQIFRMPSFNDLYYYHIGTKELKPERTTQWNVGTTFSRQLSRRLQADASLDLYINNVKDKIISVPVNLFLWQNINAGKVVIKGLDLTASANYEFAEAQSLSLRGHYSYQHAVDRSGKSSTAYNKQIPYMPCHTFSVVLGWKNPWVNVFLDANGQSGRWATSVHSDGTKIPGYAEFGTTLSHTFDIGKSQQLNASFTVSNLLNKQYEVVAHYPMPSRGWRASVQYSF